MSQLEKDTSQVNAEDDADAIFAELQAEGEDTSSAAYQQRLHELQAGSGSGAALTASMRQDCYVTLNSDDETLRFTTEHEKAVVHFRHPDFARCAIMDEHLDRIAQRHVYDEASGDELAFARVDVTNTPFVVEKLGIRVLPCVTGFAKGIVKGKVIGFEGICWNGDEKDPKVSKALEQILHSWGLLKQRMLDNDDDTDPEDEPDDAEKKNRGLKVRRGIKGMKQKVIDEDDDWD